MMNTCWVWWFIQKISALGRLKKQENHHDFETCLGYIQPELLNETLFQENKQITPRNHGGCFCVPGDPEKP